MKSIVELDERQRSIALASMRSVSTRDLSNSLTQAVQQQTLAERSPDIQDMMVSNDVKQTNSSSSGSNNGTLKSLKRRSLFGSLVNKFGAVGGNNTSSSTGDSSSPNVMFVNNNNSPSSTTTRNNTGYYLQANAISATLKSLKLSRHESSLSTSLSPEQSKSGSRSSSLKLSSTLTKKALRSMSNSKEASLKSFKDSKLLAKQAAAAPPPPPPPPPPPLPPMLPTSMVRPFMSTFKPTIAPSKQAYENKLTIQRRRASAPIVQAPPFNLILNPKQQQPENIDSDSGNSNCSSNDTDYVSAKISLVESNEGIRSAGTSTADSSCNSISLCSESHSPASSEKSLKQTQKERTILDEIGNQRQKSFQPPKFLRPPEDGANIRPSEYLKKLSSSTTTTTTTMTTPASTKRTPQQAATNKQISKEISPKEMDTNEEEEEEKEEEDVERNEEVPCKLEIPLPTALVSERLQVFENICREEATDKVVHYEQQQQYQRQTNNQESSVCSRLLKEQVSDCNSGRGGSTIIRTMHDRDELMAMNHQTSSNKRVTSSAATETAVKSQDTATTKAIATRLQQRIQTLPTKRSLSSSMSRSKQLTGADLKPSEQLQRQTDALEAESAIQRKLENASSTHSSSYSSFPPPQPEPEPQSQARPRQPLEDRDKLPNESNGLRSTLGNAAERVKEEENFNSQLDKAGKGGDINELGDEFDAECFLNQVPRKDSDGIEIPDWKRLMLAKRRASKALQSKKKPDFVSALSAKKISNDKSKEEEFNSTDGLPIWRLHLRRTDRSSALFQPNEPFQTLSPSSS